MHLANQSSGKPHYPRVHQARQAIPEFNKGGTLDIREALRDTERDPPDKQRTRVTREREKTVLRSNPTSSRSKGNARSRDIGLPTLQEARTQA